MTTENTTETTTETTNENAETAPTRFCLSGTNEEVTGKSRFRPGGDARLKGYLQRVCRGTAREDDPELEHLIGLFIEQYGDEEEENAQALSDVLEAWDESTLDFDADADHRLLHPAYLYADILGGEKWTSKLTPAPVRKRRARKVWRKVGRWIKNGTIDNSGDEKMFVYTNADGTEKRIDFARTAKPSEEEIAVAQGDESED